MIHSSKQAQARFKDQCVLRPYSEGCPGKKTPHHCVPDHCFEKPPSQGDGRYPGSISHGEGLCVCVTGATKSESKSGDSISKKDFNTEKQWTAALAEHGRVHAIFDKTESTLGKKGTPPNSATLGDLEDAAADAVNQVTGCDKASLKKQMREYHQDKKMGEGQRYRADPYGKRKAPPYSKMGSNTAMGGAPAG